MPAVPASARLLAAAATAVFVLPLLLALARFGVAWPYLVPAVQLLSAAGCAAPICFRRRDHFRVACAAAGAIVASLWTPVLIVGGLILLFTDFRWAIACFAMVAAAIAVLIAAFQRAKGAECGRPAVVVGWSAAALALTDWAYVALG
ncbi:hypothetical protein ACIBCA_22745 [Kitasatospora sp. NPDC051170]|uniref:hypothetical protein n=1 Tax=Kitasatospora sp. NPDC051170 TaxID=3364056 RepID=UPI0037BDCA43